VPRHALTAAFALIALVAPASAHARAPMEVAIQDDAVFVRGPTGYATLPGSTLLGAEGGYDAARTLGATTVRINVDWHVVAGTRAADALDWSWYDRAVDGARAHGLHVHLTLTGPAPAWATGDGRAGIRDPDARAYGRFAGAAAEHFKGRVRLYSIWNEPNWPSWLAPQRRAAPIYRRLYEHGYAAVKRADPAARVLIGELAPMGPPEAAIAPLRFLRSVTCRDRSFNPTRRCRPLRADGFAHHPYTLRWAPTFAGPGRDDVTLGSLGRLERTLDGLACRGALTTPRGRPLDLWLTEYGYHADSARFGEQTRARYAVRAFGIAARDRRVRELTWYQLAAPPKGPRRVWDTALLDYEGHPRPTYDALAAWVRRHRP
jgi:hypothetical protein